MHPLSAENLGWFVAGLSWGVVIGTKLWRLVPRGSGYVPKKRGAAPHHPPPAIMAPGAYKPSRECPCRLCEEAFSYKGDA